MWCLYPPMPIQPPHQKKVDCSGILDLNYSRLKHWIEMFHIFLFFQIIFVFFLPLFLPLSPFAVFPRQILVF